MKKNALLLFVMASLGEIMSILLGYEVLHQISKPTIMVTLIAYYWFESKSDRSLALIVAMIDAWIGDM